MRFRRGRTSWHCLFQCFLNQRQVSHIKEGMFIVLPRVAQCLCTKAKLRPLAFVYRRGVEQTHPARQTVAETPSSCLAPQVCPLLWPGEQTLEMGRAQANQVSWDLRESKVHVQIRMIRDINRHFHWLKPLICSGQLSCQPCLAVLSIVRWLHPHGISENIL